MTILFILLISLGLFLWAGTLITSRGRDKTDEERFYILQGILLMILAYAQRGNL